MKNYLIIIILLITVFSCGPVQEPKTIYIVRHAEKILVGEDPGLNVAGTVRSKKLAQILENEDIKHIYSTNTIRTRATVQPLADKLGISIESYGIKKHDDLVKELRKNKGDAVIVGHSNSLHHLANYFVGKNPEVPEIEDDDYNFIFVVTLNKDGSSIVVRKEYKDF